MESDGWLEMYDKLAEVLAVSVEPADTSIDVVSAEEKLIECNEIMCILNEAEDRIKQGEDVGCDPELLDTRRNEIAINMVIYQDAIDSYQETFDLLEDQLNTRPTVATWSRSEDINKLYRELALGGLTTRKCMEMMTNIIESESFDINDGWIGIEILLTYMRGENILPNQKQATDLVVMAAHSRNLKTISVLRANMLIYDTERLEQLYNKLEHNLSHEATCAYIRSVISYNNARTLRRKELFDIIKSNINDRDARIELVKFIAIHT